MDKNIHVNVSVYRHGDELWKPSTAMLCHDYLSGLKPPETMKTKGMELIKLCHHVTSCYISSYHVIMLHLIISCHIWLYHHIMSNHIMSSCYISSYHAIWHSVYLSSFLQRHTHSSSIVCHQSSVLNSTPYYSYLVPFNPWYCIVSHHKPWNHWFP